MKNLNQTFSFTTHKGNKLIYYFNRSYFITNDSILWLNEASPGIFYIGIDYFTLQDSESIINLSTRSIGSFIDVNKVLVRFETSKPGCCGGLTMKMLFLPFQVEILEINNFLIKDLSILTTDPFYNAWIYKIRVISPENEILNNKSQLNGVFVKATEPELIQKEIRNFLRKNNAISFGTT